MRSAAVIAALVGSAVGVTVKINALGDSITGSPVRFGFFIFYFYFFASSLLSQDNYHNWK